MPPIAFFQGKFVPLTEAKVSIRTHALQYGTGAFEGIRANWNQEQEQLYIFRLREHYERLLSSCKLLKINLPHSLDDLCRITVELVERNGYREDIYIRPVAYKSGEAIGLRMYGVEDDFFIFVMPFGPYLDITKGITCTISSWRRPDDSMLPPRAKLTGIYVNSSLAKSEAMENGFDEAIMLTHDGNVSEGSGENIFLVENGMLVTPSVSEHILVGITRNTVIQLARDELGLEVQERQVSRGELYMAEECFLTGSAAHVTPVLEIDRRQVGSGEIGKVTKAIQDLYFNVIQGRVPKYSHWCTPVYSKVAQV
ncbi:MAG TPA: branched-chain amino acid transaminase [Dehalococcoidia bacterium]|nr:branched-chain amino acid transaminase [Dehalococcoidia bacterium]